MEKRLNTIDFVRGLALFLMIIYHFLYDMYYFNLGVDMNFLPIILCGKTSSTLFILVSGYCSDLSRHNLSSGFKLMIYATIISIGSFILLDGDIILFGILFLLGFSKIFTYLSKKVLIKISPLFGIILNLLLYLSFYSISSHYINLGFTKIMLSNSLYQTNYFSFLGIYNSSFSSLDYFPVLPYIFLFLTGYYLSRLIKTRKIKVVNIKNRFIEYLGSHTLIVYFTHQIVLFAIVSIIAKIIGE